MNQKYVEGQIINQRSLRNDLQQKIKNCGRKVRSQCKRFCFKADNSGLYELKKDCWIHVDVKFNYENATFDNIDEAMWLRSEGWTPLMPNLIDMITFRAGLVTCLHPFS